MDITDNLLEEEKKQDAEDLKARKELAESNLQGYHRMMKSMRAMTGIPASTIPSVACIKRAGGRIVPRVLYQNPIRV